MAKDLKPGQTVRVTINKTISRESARKTIERLFRKDPVVCAPIEAREANFKAIPKRRGGRIWTKRPNQVHLPLKRGDAATLKATPQAIKDLGSVSDFVDVQPQ